jgi:hypothetical protein
MVRVQDSVIWVAGYDLHYPKYDAPTFRGMMQFIEAVKPAGFIFGGDQFDNAEISPHNRRKALYKPTGSYKQAEKEFDKYILSPLEKAIGNANRVWIVGNHDDWEREFIETHPELQGCVERPESLNLVRRGWDIVGLGRAKKLGHLNVIHGEVLTGVGNQAGKFPSAKAVDIYGDNVLAGHTHAPQSFSKISPVEQRKKHMGWIAPILGNVNPVYLENRPTAWMNGFVVIELHLGGMFNLYPIISFNGVFSYGGRVYGR